MRRLLPLVTAALLLAAGCATPQDGGVLGGSTSTSPAPTPYGPGELVLQVRYQGGMIMPEMLLARLPLVSVYGDGRVVTYHRPEVPSYADEPALPDLRVRQLTPAGLDLLVRMAVDAGVGDVEGLSILGALDAPWLHFTVLTSEGVREADMDPWLRDDASELSPALQEDAARLSAFYDALLDLPAALGTEAGAGQSPYEPHALAVLSQPWNAGDSGRADRDWPGPALPGTPTSWDLHCALVTGADVAAVRAAAATATVRTPWRWAGYRHDLTLRPLLPDESSCADLETGGY